MKGSLIRIQMTNQDSESGTFVQTKFIGPCLDFEPGTPTSVERALCRFIYYCVLCDIVSVKCLVYYWKLTHAELAAQKNQATSALSFLQWYCTHSTCMPDGCFHNSICDWPPQHMGAEWQQLLCSDDWYLLK